MIKIVSRILSPRVADVSLLDRFQKADKIPDLPRRQFEFGHGRVTGDDPFRQRFFQILNRIIFVKRPKGRRNRQRALVVVANGVASGAIGRGELKSALSAS